MGIGLSGRHYFYHPVRRTPQTAAKHRVGDAAACRMGDDGDPNAGIAAAGIPSVQGHHAGRGGEAPAESMRRYRSMCGLGDLVFRQLPPAEGGPAYEPVRQLGWDGDPRSVPPLLFNERTGEAVLMQDVWEPSTPLGLHLIAGNPAYAGPAADRGCFRISHLVTEWYENLWDLDRWNDAERLLACCGSDYRIEREGWSTRARYAAIDTRPVDELLYAATLRWGIRAYDEQQAKIAARDAADRPVRPRREPPAEPQTWQTSAEVAAIDRQPLYGEYAAQGK